MTDNTAPDEIAMDWEPGKAITSGPLFADSKITHWVRKDISDAAVAAAYEACGQMFQKRGDEGLGAPYMALNRCRTLTPANARAALEAAKREAFNEGIEAAAMCGDKAIHGYAGRCLKGDRYALGVQAGVERFSRAIRALLKEDTDNEK